ncbi:hypothetical protein J437_LFUL012843 [Ladona fulva]|uniref:Uncharacterized protein n=1 Tax=Ladona fulva TaxID=123851 RepID=A0A8K0P7W3_LADFU|nr:hypothetical protein J437_LFUL012843 [Ladona fulva]
MIPAERIKDIWDNFIRAESGTAEKSVWLDVFLATVLSEKTEDSVINEIISFCLPGDVFTLIGCELFADVHQICSFAGDGEDLSSLQNYLLKGRGWRSLAVLDELGVKGLSCSEELSNLLISLYPVCFRCESSSSGKNPFVSSKCLKNPGINSSVKLHSKQKSWHAHCDGKQEIGEVVKQSTGESPIQTSPSKCSASSESELLEEELTISKSNTLKIRLDPMDFDYFTSIVRSEDESQLDKFNPDSKRFMRKLDCEKEKCPDDYINEKVRAVLESEVSVLEFCQLTMKLLCTLCDAEESKENSNAKIAVQVLEFVLENLCCLQYGSEMTISANLSADSVENLKVEMSWLLYSSLSKVFRYPETTCTIIEHKTFATILMLLEDSLKKLYCDGSMEQLGSEKSCHNANTQLKPDYVYSLLNCIFLFFNSLLGMHKPDDFYFSLFLEIFCIFEKCHNGSLIELVVTSLSRVCEPTENESQGRHLSSGFQVLDLVGSLISKVKEVRMEIALKDGSLSEITVTHSKRRHVRGRKSNLTHLNHHHKTDVFGVPGLAFNPEKEIPPCTVSVLFGKLVDLISSGNVNLNLKFHAVQVATKCGTCCCFPSFMLLDAVFSALLSDISESANKKTFQTSCFILLERTLYPQLWGCISHLTPVSVLENHSCCLSSTRRDYKSTEGNISRKSMRGGSVSPNSSSLGFISSYEAGHLSSSDVLSQWDKLSFYKELIDSKDFKLSHQTFSHLIRIFAVVTPKVLHELLSLVIFPAFVSAKKKYLCSGCEMAKFKIFSCLSIFSCYLGKSPEFVLEFFDFGTGLLHFLDLVFLQDFTQTCCYVLEEIILVIVNKLQEDMNLHCASVNSLKSVHSNLLLLTAIDNFSERMVVNLKRIFESSQCNAHLVDIMSHQSNEYLSMERYFNGVGSENADSSLEDSSLKYFSSKFLSKIGILDLNTFERVLKFSFMFWKACASLILKCKLYQEIFSLTIVCKKGFLLLQMLVLYVTSCSHITGK